MSSSRESHVVTCFLRNRGDVLLLLRSAQVGSYQGQWGAAAGYAEGDPEGQAYVEVEEETGLGGAVHLVNRGMPFPVEDAALGKRWVVHPFLFDSDRRDVKLDWESDEAAWVRPTEILRRDVVPGLWQSYHAVAPTLAQIRDDRTHGAAYLSLRALEVLRDRAGELAVEGVPSSEAWAELTELAASLRAARRAMAAVVNRVNGVLYACRDAPSAGAVEDQAHEAIRHALEADEQAAQEAARLVAGKRVLTLSRSGTVTKALLQGRPTGVFVMASWPDGEGIGTARALAKGGLEVTLLPDAAVAAVLADDAVDLVLVGADTVLPSGAVANKTGTLAAALAAHHFGIPFYAVAARDKVAAEESWEGEEGPPEAVYDEGPPLAVRNPTFDRTPGSLVTGIVTEAGVEAPDRMQAVADEMRRRAEW